MTANILALLALCVSIVALTYTIVIDRRRPKLLVRGSIIHIFDRAPGDVRVSGPYFNVSPPFPGGTIDNALMGATTLRLFHLPAPFFTGPPPNGMEAPRIVASLGIDNITAVPEPGAGVLLLVGLLGLGIVRKRFGRSEVARI